AEAAVFGDLRGRVTVEVLAGLVEQADIPGDPEIVVRLAAARIGDARPGIAVAPLRMQPVLLGIGARARDEADAEAGTDGQCQQLSRRFLRAEVQPRQHALAARIEGADLLKLPRPILERAVRRLGLRPPTAVER